MWSVNLIFKCCVYVGWVICLLMKLLFEVFYFLWGWRVSQNSLPNSLRVCLQYSSHLEFEDSHVARKTWGYKSSLILYYRSWWLLMSFMICLSFCFRTLLINRHKYLNQRKEWRYHLCSVFFLFIKYRYLGTGELEEKLVSTVNETLRKQPDLEVRWFLDKVNLLW